MRPLCADCLKRETENARPGRGPGAEERHPEEAACQEEVGQAPAPAAEEAD